MLTYVGFDIMALQELWMEADHNKIGAAVPEGYHITGARFCKAQMIYARVDSARL